MPVDLEFEFWNFEHNTLLNFSVVLYDNLGFCLLNTVSPGKNYPKGRVKGICHIPGHFLNDGVCRVRLVIVKDMSVPLIDLDNVAIFEVQDIEREGAWYSKWIGAVRPIFKWETMATSD
jgi:lipopolysaccharide transport system ATP-binding protein